MSDKYDDAIEYLTKHPDRIRECWRNPSRTDAGCLFAFITPDGWHASVGGKACGCPTLIRADATFSPAWTPELTEIIRNDERIPKHEAHITVESLPAFAEIQRLADRTIRTK